MNLLEQFFFAAPNYQFPRLCRDALGPVCRKILLSHVVKLLFQRTKIEHNRAIPVDNGGERGVCRRRRMGGAQRTA
ncbi:hypothetical protein ACTZWT_04970 [Rhodopseudomonas sp. NSM]